MNNWRLLLLAVIAVFQPIASFTESNLIDGRQRCCDRLSSAPIRDTISSLHGTYRFDQSTSALRRLNDEIREDRHIGLKHHDSIFGRSLTERRLIQERGQRQAPFIEARSTRVKYHHVSITSDRNHDRSLDVHKRETTAGNIRDLQSQDLTRRVVDRTSKDALGHRYARAYTESSRNGLSQNDIRADRLVQRLSKKSFDSQRENYREVRTGRLRLTLNMNMRHVLRQGNHEVTRIAINNVVNRQHTSREKLDIMQREHSLRPDTRRHIDNNDVRRDLERNRVQTRSLSENRLNRIHDIIRLNFRADNKEVAERREQRDLRQQNKENSNRRVSSEMQIAQRTRGSRIMNERNTKNEREINGRREIRNHERASIPRQDEFREISNQRFFHDRIQIERKNTRERDEDERRGIRHTERIPMATQDGLQERLNQKHFRERIQMDTLNERGVQERRNIRQNEKTPIATRDELQKGSRGTKLNERRENRHNVRISMETRDSLRENSVQRLSSERIQIRHRYTRDARIINIRNERDLDERRDIRHNGRNSMETRDGLKKNSVQRISRESIQIYRRNTREARITNIRKVRDLDEGPNARMSSDTRYVRSHNDNRLTLERHNDRNIDSLREMSNDRILRVTQNEIRENSILKLSLERNLMEQRNIRQLRIVTSPNERKVNSRREIKTTETSEDTNHMLSLSRERHQMGWINTREISIITRNERDPESRKSIRYDERLSIQTRKNPGQKLFRERFVMDRRFTRELRMMNRKKIESRLSQERIQMERGNSREFTRVTNEKDIENRQEIRYNEKKTRDEINSDRQLAQENRLTDRMDNRESRTINSLARHGRDTENRREIRFNERLSSRLRGAQFTKERRMAASSLDRVIIAERKNIETERRVRSVERRNLREITAAPTLTRSAVSERRSLTFRNKVEHRNEIENRERESIDARSRNVASARNRDRINAELVGQMETENNSIIGNWQYVLYTLQAAYLCAFFTQMLTPSRTEKSNKMSLRWLPISSNYNPIKVD